MHYKKCICEYDGAAYSGWQYQDNAESVQKFIELALSKLYNQKITVVGSGRTDAGVHARGQVFSYRSEVFRDNHSVVCALNCLLPKDIVILEVCDVPEGFNAQFSAVNKTYMYRIINRPSRAALDWNRAWFRRGEIDMDLLRDILKVFIGTHDFTSFCLKKSLKQNTVRTVNFVNVEKSSDYIEIRINANGFLHNMVRIIVGTAVQLAQNGGSPEDVKNTLVSKDRRVAGVTAPAQGLYLEEVFYE